MLTKKTIWSKNLFLVIWDHFQVSKKKGPHPYIGAYKIGPDWEKWAQCWGPKLPRIGNILRKWAENEIEDMGNKVNNYVAERSEAKMNRPSVFWQESKCFETLKVCCRAKVQKKSYGPKWPKMVQNGFWDEKKNSKIFSLITPPKKLGKILKILKFFFIPKPILDHFGPFGTI